MAALPAAAPGDRIRRTLVVGLGNPLLTDDSVGLEIAQRLTALLADRPDVDVDLDYHGGLRLMEHMLGYQRSIVVDAIVTGEAPPGTVHTLDAVDAVRTQHSASAHDANLVTALDFARMMGADVPDPSDVLVIGVEAEDTQTFCEQRTARVEAAIPAAVQAVLGALGPAPPSAPFGGPQ